jgi:hypothetical protein
MGKQAKIDAEGILEAAKSATPRAALASHRDAIGVLRSKKFSWREVADFLREHGVETDHTKVYRFMTEKEGPADNGSFQVPSADRYAEALSAIDISATQRKMLEAHYTAHNRTITYTDLARASGADSHRAANSAYGKLGRTLGERLGIRFVEGGSKNVPFYSSAIGMGNPYAAPGTHFQLVMHHELAKAIDQLGWFG